MLHTFFSSLVYLTIVTRFADTQSSHVRSDEYFRIPDAPDSSPSQEETTLKPNLVHHSNLGHFNKMGQDVEMDQNTHSSATKLEKETNTRNYEFSRDTSRSQLQQIEPKFEPTKLDHIKQEQNFEKNNKNNVVELFAGTHHESSSGVNSSEDDYFRIPEDPSADIISSHIEEPKIQNKQIRDKHLDHRREKTSLKMKQNIHENTQQFADLYSSSVENNRGEKETVISDTSNTQRRSHFIKQQPEPNLIKDGNLGYSHEENQNPKLKNHIDTNLFTDGLSSFVKHTPDEKYLTTHHVTTTPNSQITQVGDKIKSNLINNENLDLSKDKSKLHADTKLFPETQTSYDNDTPEDDYYRIPDDTPTSQVEQPEVKFKTNLISHYKSDNFEDNNEKIDPNQNINEHTKLFADTQQSFAKTTPEMEHLDVTTTPRSNYLELEGLKTEFKPIFTNTLQEETQNLVVKQHDNTDTKPFGDTQSKNTENETSDDYFQIPEEHSTYNNEPKSNQNVISHEYSSHTEEESKNLKFEKRGDADAKPEPRSYCKKSNPETSKVINADEESQNTLTNFLGSTETCAQHDASNAITPSCTSSANDYLELSATVSPITYPPNPTAASGHMEYPTESTPSFTTSNHYPEEISPSETYSTSSQTDMPDSNLKYPIQSSYNDHFSSPPTKSSIAYPPKCSKNPESTHYRRAKVHRTVFSPLYRHHGAPKIIRPYRPELIPQFNPYKNHHGMPSKISPIISAPNPSTRKHEPTISNYSPELPIPIDQPPKVAPITYPPSSRSNSYETYPTKSNYHSDRPPIPPTDSPFAYPPNSISFSSQPSSSYAEPMINPTPTVNVNSKLSPQTYPPKLSPHSSQPTINHPAPVSPPNSPQTSKVFSDKNIINPDHGWFVPPNFPPITFPQFAIGGLDKPRTNIKPNQNADQQRKLNKLRSKNIYIVL